MSVDTRVEGDADACRRTAQRLLRLSRSLEAATDNLVSQARISEADFEGLAGQAFRTRAAGLAWDSDDVCHETAGVSEALHDFAAGLDEIEDVMRRVRWIAQAHLVVDGWVIRRPGAYADEGQRSLFARLVALIESVRQTERTLHHTLATALATHAGTTPPGPPPSDPTRGSAPGWPGAQAPPPGVAAPAPELPDAAAPSRDRPTRGGPTDVVPLVEGAVAESPTAPATGRSVEAELRRLEASLVRPELEAALVPGLRAELIDAVLIDAVLIDMEVPDGPR